MDAVNKDSLKWGAHIAVVAAYAACYEVIRYFSYSDWMLPAGLRLACLLLVPQRFWLALAIGETIPIAEMGIMTAHRFGALWAFWVAIPPIALCMPVVALFRQRSKIAYEDGRVGISAMLTLILACALITTLGNSIAFATIVMADGSSGPALTLRIVMFWLIGNYVGALTLTPVIVAMHKRIALVAPGGILVAMAKAPIKRVTILGVVPALLMLVWLGLNLSDSAQIAARVAIATPIVALAVVVVRMT